MEPRETARRQLVRAAACVSLSSKTARQGRLRRPRQLPHHDLSGFECLERITGKGPQWRPALFCPPRYLRARRVAAWSRERPSRGVDCAGSWGAWSDCTGTCGPGRQSRLYSVTVHAAHGGRPETCDFPDGEGSESRACENQPCPVDCVGEWGDPSACSATCGAAHRTKTYTVRVAAVRSHAQSTPIDRF